MTLRPYDDAFRDHGQLVPPYRDAKIVTATISSNGTAVTLWAAPAHADALTSTRGGRVQPTLAEPVAVRVTVQGPSESPSVVTIQEFNLRQPHVALLPGGRVIVVGARCKWNPDHVEPNAVIYSAEGQPMRQSVVGDGVSHLRTSSNGEIWIGYSDGGIFGNYGWGSPGPPPIGQPGLISLSSDLEITWQFPYQIDLRIADLEAINVVDETVWASYYTDYPVVCIDKQVVTTWVTRGAPVTQLLVDHDRIALIGGEVLLGRLEPHRVVPTSSVHLALPTAASEGGPYLVSCGEQLHLIAPDGRWLVTDLKALESRNGSGS